MNPQIEEHIKACHPCQVNSCPEWPEPVCPTELSSRKALDTPGYQCLWTISHRRIGSSPNWLLLEMAREANPKVNHQHISLAQRSVCYTWLPIQNQVWQCIILHLTRVPLYPKVMGCRTETVTEYWPQDNCQVERFNQGLLKHILTATATNMDWRKTLPTMLWNYRSTPHQTTQATPARLLMHR